MVQFHSARIHNARSHTARTHNARSHTARPRAWTGWAIGAALALGAGIGGTAMAEPAHGPLARATCGERAEVTAKLHQKFGEMQAATGLVSSDRMLEVWRSDDGSWTILMTRPDGQTCIMAAGELWREAPAGTSGDPI